MPDQAAQCRRVLLISYLFPPSGGVGVQRALSYARYLPACGCKLWVLTARNAAAPVQDPGLVALIPPDLPVERAFTPEVPYAWRDWVLKRFVLRNAGKSNNAKPSPSTPAATAPARRNAVLDVLERVAAPDPQKFWVPFALRQAAHLIRKHSIEAVMITTPPFSSGQIGVRLKQDFPHLRLITEFRDEWVGYYLKELMQANDYRRRLAETQERQIVEASDFVVAVTPAQRESILSRYPEQAKSKFLSVTNGYDPDVFKDFRPRPHGQDRCVITYMGSVYNNPVYSPRPYFEALAMLPPDLAARMETRFIGRIARESEPVFANQPNVRLYGFVPQLEGFRLLEETDCLLVVVGNMTALAGKMFEYLATGKPIIAITPENSETARIIRETRTGWCADPANPAAIARILQQAWEYRNNPHSFQPDWEAIRRYSRPSTVQAVATATGLGDSAP